MLFRIDLALLLFFQLNFYDTPLHFAKIQTPHTIPLSKTNQPKPYLDSEKNNLSISFTNPPFKFYDYEPHRNGKHVVTYYCFPSTDYTRETVNAANTQKETFMCRILYAHTIRASAIGTNLRFRASSYNFLLLLRARFTLRIYLRYLRILANGHTTAKQTRVFCIFPSRAVSKTA